MPYFLKSESMPNPYDVGSREEKEDLAVYDGSKGIHSSEGRVKLGYVPWFGDTHRPFFRALEGLGVPSNPSSVSASPCATLFFVLSFLHSSPPSPLLSVSFTSVLPTSLTPSSLSSQPFYLPSPMLVPFYHLR